MIDKLLKSISYIFHPIFMPLLGVLFYFSKTPRFVPVDIRNAKLIALTILTIILPLALYFLLKLVGRVSSIFLPDPKERVLPLLINCFILLMILQAILQSTNYIELYFFFLGILISNMASLLLAILKFKTSIHMIGISGLFMFFIALSIHFSININGTLAVMSVIIGAIATSRLHLKAHSPAELITGLFVGLIPQLILVPYWL